MSDAAQGFLARVKRWVRPVFALIATIFVVSVARDIASRFTALVVEVHWIWVLAAVFPAGVAVVFQYRAWWNLVLVWEGKRMPIPASLRVYVDGQMARYTPGKVGLPAVRVAAAGLLGVSPQAMIGTLLAEVLAWSACGAIVGAGLILVPGVQANDSLFLSGTLGVLAVGALIALVILMVTPARIWPQPLVRLLGSSSQGTLMPWRAPMWQMLHFVASALSGFCLVLALGGTTLDGLYLGAAQCVAIVVGFLALLAPGGLGVREAALTAFSEPVLGTEPAVALGLLARGASLSAELLLFFLMRWLSPKPRTNPAR